MDLTRINRRQEQQRQLTARQHRRRRQQSGGQEQKGHEIAVAVWARDDVTGYALIGPRELGERVHAGGATMLLIGVERLRIFLKFEGLNNKL